MPFELSHHYRRELRKRVPEGKDHGCCHCCVVVVPVEAFFAVVNVIVTLFVLVVCRCCCCCCSVVVVVAVLLLVVVVVGASMKETLSPSSSIRPIQRFAAIRDAIRNRPKRSDPQGKRPATPCPTGIHPSRDTGRQSNTWTVENTGQLM